MSKLSNKNVGLLSEVQSDFSKGLLRIRKYFVKLAKVRVSIKYVSEVTDVFSW